MSARSGKGKPDDRTRRTDGYGVGATTKCPVRRTRGQRADGEPRQPRTVPRTVRRPSSEERESGPREIGGSRTGRKDWGIHNQSEFVQRTAEGQLAGHARAGLVNSAAAELAERTGDSHNRSDSVPTAGQGQVPGHARAGSGKSAAAERAVRSVDNRQTETLRNRSRNGRSPTTGSHESGSRELGSSESKTDVRRREHSNRTAPNPLAERRKTE